MNDIEYLIGKYDKIVIGKNNKIENLESKNKSLSDEIDRIINQDYEYAVKLSKQLEQANKVIEEIRKECSQKSLNKWTVMDYNDVGVLAQKIHSVLSQHKQGEK